MMHCGEVIVTPNDDSTYKLEFVGVKFMDNGKELEGNIVFPKVSKGEADAVVNMKNNVNICEFSSLATDDEPEIYKIIIPD